MRLLYFTLGWVFFITGAIGALLPVLPTTPFMLLALWAFSKSSDRFHDWLYSHRFFGPPLQQWRKHRVIPLPAKIMAIVMMSGSFVFLLVVKTTPAWALYTVGGIMLFAVWFILRQPSHSPDTHPE